jgi:uncharacterized BrkB/YihY/UPF0761 family membrane protein
MDLLNQALPPEAASMLEETVQRIATERQGGLLSFGFLGTLVGRFHGNVRRHAAVEYHL